MQDRLEAELIDPVANESRRLPWWKRLIFLVVGGLGIVLFVGCSWLIFVGVYGPETSVYRGSQVPKRFVRVITKVGALDEGETILFFYSDAMTNIRDGFYFVSDKKVAVYSNAILPDPLTTVDFDQIEDVTLDRYESVFRDSEINVYTREGWSIWFPVSSELDRDEDFFEAISMRVPARGILPPE
ncbi:MAG: hypothetical protein GY768_09820 [Planctomycetaceae bacterium]|nr:hypothetical protein [Planctomycetaceae bacterium]